MNLIEAIRRLGLALGSRHRFERQWNQKIVGLRTNALVVLGACGFVDFSASLVTATRPGSPLKSYAYGRRQTGSLSGDSGGRSTNLGSLRSSSRC